MLSAKQVLDARWDGKLPVDVAAIATAMGVLVRPNTGVVVVETWLAGRHEVIEFNPRQAQLSQRYAIAHALGHLALSHLQDGDRIKDDAANFSIKIKASHECEANQFAMHLMVPEGALHNAVLHRGIHDAAKLAETFGVSKALLTACMQQVRLV